WRFNIIFLLAGLVITGIAIWVIVSKDTMFDLVQLVTKDVDVDRATLDNYMNSTSMLLAAAYIVLVFGLHFNCCWLLRLLRRAQGELFTPSPISIVLIAEIVGSHPGRGVSESNRRQAAARLVTLEREHFLPLGLTLNNKTTDAVITAWVNYAQTSTDITGRTPCGRRSRNREFKRQSLQTMPSHLLPAMKATRSEFAGKESKTGTMSPITWRTRPAPNTGNGVVTEIICVVMACSLIQKIRSEAAGTTA
uniref:Protein S-acyltransferase n=1 Tax=Macrostomum lignano TaxID=282301 RepID=A0A1I8FJL0_9PLAT